MSHNGRALRLFGESQRPLQDVCLFHGHGDSEHYVLTSNSATKQNQTMIRLLEQLRESAGGSMRQRIDQVLEDVC
jgi:hypothetical protein